ncbi:MAG: glycosyltransferase family 4 protein [Alphaproteobacteria bacterium]|nr:glycosyltransferase family 4 protein [Alphaproteobacteria bacterium]
MRIAVYAPLKHPDHPTPSGDRRVARLLIDALRMAGHDVDIASRLRSFDRKGDMARQARIARIGARMADRLLHCYRAHGNAPALWLTYHLYYKAPDHLGPRVARALSIPYVAVEASIANKRANGPWDIGHRACIDALRAADAIVTLNARDDAALDKYLRPDCRRVALAPFLDPSVYRATRGAASTLRLLAVGMLRHGDKQRSYEILAAALTKLGARNWRLAIAGDGPARADIEKLFAPFGDRVTFLGLRDEAALAQDYANADIFVWPAVNEAFCMALLEAQASGLPAIAGNFGGVGSILADGKTGFLTAPGDADDFAAKLAALLDDPDLRKSMGDAARLKAEREHGLDGASATLDALVRGLAA